jgi:hypothetical protein
MTDLVPDGYWDRLETMLTACTKVEEPDHDIDIDFFNQGAIMNDQELLEFAAKAAEINGVYVEENRMIREFCFKKYEYIRADSFEWNPLVNDGDALRLAVKLELDITVMKNKAFYSHDELCAATRRAIVIAAAKIGKDMK